MWKLIQMGSGAVYQLLSKSPATKRILDELIKNGGKPIKLNQVPKGTKPTTVNPGNVATVLRQTRVAKPSAKRPNPNKPKPPASRANSKPVATRTSPKSPTAPKPGNKPRVPSNTAKPRPSTKVAKPKSPRSGSNSSGPSRPMKDITPNKNAPGRPSGSRIVGVNPKAMRAPNTKLGALDTATPEVVVAPSDDKKPAVKKPPLKKTTKKQSDANKKAAETKKVTKKKTEKKTKKDAPTKTAPKKSLRPRKRPAAGPVTNESFGKAFARNRANDEPTFTWNKKKYTTRYKEETIAEHKKKFGVEGKY